MGVTSIMCIARSNINHIHFVSSYSPAFVQTVFDTSKITAWTGLVDWTLGVYLSHTSPVHHSSPLVHSSDCIENNAEHMRLSSAVVSAQLMHFFPLYNTHPKYKGIAS